MKKTIISKNILKTLSKTNILHALKNLQAKAPFSFEFKAFTVDYGMGENLEYLSKHCEEYEIPHEIIKTNIFDLANEKIRDNSSFCSFFSRMRRGSLYSTIQDMGYKKLALAHHLDDAIESFFMNMFYNGSLRTMPPIYKSDKDIWVVRPFIFLRERQFQAFVDKNNIQTIHDDACPAMKFKVKMPHARAKMKDFIQNLEMDNKNIINTIKSSFCNIHTQSFFDKEKYDFQTPEYEKIISSSKIKQLQEITNKDIDEIK